MEKIKEKCELILDHNPVDAINDIMDETFGKKKHDLVSKQDLKSTILKKLEELISSKSSDYNKGVQDSINLIDSL